MAFDSERAAMILVEASFSDDKDVAKRWGITDRTIRNYRVRLDSDPQFSAIFQKRKAAIDSNWVSVCGEMASHQCTLAEYDARMAKRRISKASVYHREKDLEIAICDDIAKITKVLGLPDALNTDRRYRIGKKEIDIVISHGKDRFTLCEIKSCRGQENLQGGWLLYPAIGQLLYYYELFRDTYNLDGSKINLAILGDYAPDTYFYLALQNVSKPIYYLNAAEVLVG